MNYINELKPQIRCVNTRALIEYINSYESIELSSLFNGLHPLIEKMDDPVSFLMNINNWIPASLSTFLYKRARALLNDPMIAFKVAKYAVQRDFFGLYKNRFKRLFPLSNAITKIKRLNDKWNRCCDINISQQNRSHTIIHLKYSLKDDFSKDICLFYQGILTFFPLLWDGIPVIVDEKSCFFEGAPYCEYILNLPHSGIIYRILSRFFNCGSTLIDFIERIETEKKHLQRQYNKIHRLNLSLKKKITQLEIIHETGKDIVSELNIEKLLNVTMNRIIKKCHINHAIIMTINHENRKLEFIYGIGFKYGIPEDLKNYKIDIDDDENILIRIIRSRESQYIKDVELCKKIINNTMDSDCLKPIYVTPLITRGRVIGIIIAEIEDSKEAVKQTKDIIDLFASQIGAGIENAKLYMKLKQQMFELKKSQVLLSRSERFSFLGTLSAKLAHEIKNPMTAIATFIQLLPTKYNDPEYRDQFYKIAMEEVSRINNLIEELLNLVRNKESNFILGDIHALIDKMILLITPQYKSKDIEIVRNFDPSIGYIRMDSDKLKQAILNLLANGVDFIPQGGKIEIKTMKISDNGMDEQILIEISDNGPGIPLENIDKIFDPFFSTKNHGDLRKGTGLGLFIAYQNIQDHGGTIEVSSRVGHGTTFRIILPVINHLS